MSDSRPVQQHRCCCCGWEFKTLTWDVLSGSSERNLAEAPIEMVRLALCLEQALVDRVYL